MSVAVKFPFSIGGGSVVTTDNPTEAIGSRVTFCLGTLVGERVMRPGWGIDIMNHVYAMGAGLEAAVVEGVEEAFRQWFPSYELRGTSVAFDKQDPSRVNITVRYGSYGKGIDEVSRVGTPVPGGAEIFKGEGL
jgi:phage baseplate assembly protein W